jgi:YggT family protein
MSAGEIIFRIIEVVSLVIFVRVILSWVVIMGRVRNEAVVAAYRFFEQITDPILAPIRRALPPTSGIDFSPVIAIVILWILGAVISQFL